MENYKKPLLPDLRHGLAALLIVLGAWVVIGWLVHSTQMVQIAPGLVAMVFNTASCFLLGGFALWFADSTEPWSRHLVRLIGIFVTVLATLAFIENVADSNLGIDLGALHAWLHDVNAHPGRMAPNTALGFLAAGLVLVLHPYQANAICVRIAIFLSFLVISLGVTGLIGYTLDLSALYSWFKGTRMALHTAVGMIVLGRALLALVVDAKQRRDALAPDERITMIGTLTLLVVAFSTGLAGFVALQERTRHEIERGLNVSLQGRIALVQSALKEGHERSRIFATSLVTSREFVDALHASPTAHVHKLKSLVEQRMRVGKLLWIRVDRPDGSVLIEIGRPTPAAAMIAPLHGANAGETLAWDNEYILYSTVPMQDADKLVARLHVSRSLPTLQQLFMADAGYGATGESGLCGQQGDKVRCFPQIRQPKPYITPFVPRGGQRTPMSLALDGEQGIFTGRDYRGHEVIAAYGPIGDTGLGMVVKQDSWEIFEPIANQLKRVLPIILVLTAAGMFLLRSQVRPLARRLVRSEAEARAANIALADEERRVRAVLENIGDGIITMDTDGFIRSANPAACHIFGYAIDALVGRDLSLLMPERMREMHRKGMRRYLREGTPRVVNKGAIELTGLHRDGHEFPIELSVTLVTDDGSLLFVGIVRDISERIEVQKSLHDEKERLRVTLHSIGDAVITTDTRGIVHYLNPVAQEMTGWPKDEAQGRHIDKIFNVVDDKTGERARNPVDIVLASGDISGLAENTELIRRDGTRIAIEDSAAPIRDQNGEISGVVIVFHDVTQARRLAEQVSYQATHDGLTDLVNRREFERRAATALQKADSLMTPDSKGTSLLYLDLDQFKIVNDTCGHVAGDQLLIQVSQLIRSKLRSEDTLARLGGDEFAILLENCPPDVAQRVAENVRQTVKDLQFVWQDRSFGIGVSIGLVSRHGDQTLADLLKAADSACYVAKEKGRNLVHVYREADAELMRRSGEMGWVARIEHALRENRFQLYVQPIVPAAWTQGDRHDHYEVLVRLRDEDSKLIPPNAFIPAAERYGLMPRLDRWIVEASLALLASRPADATPLSLSINLSATSINQEDFLPFLVEQLGKHRVRAADVCFEITETAAIANLTAAARMMHELKTLGCRIALDDFGSGMSSFAYLKHLPVDYVKIDGAFVKDIAEDPMDHAMVGAINNIAHVMRVRTVAEFVENDAIVRCLRDIGVDYMQGYGIGHPVPAEKLGNDSPLTA